MSFLFLSIKSFIDCKPADLARQPCSLTGLGFRILNASVNYLEFQDNEILRFTCDF